jgi:predicted DNA-binding transcriptional regulator AlpA
MNLQETTIEAGEIAAALGIGRAHFMRKVRQLINFEGMPDRLPGRKRWSRVAIETWIRGYGDQKAAQQIDARSTTSIATDRARLRAAYVHAGPRLIFVNERVGA